MTQQAPVQANLVPQFPPKPQPNVSYQQPPQQQMPRQPTQQMPRQPQQQMPRHNHNKCQ